ncbi:MAG: hypothetical protein C0507_06240 [Cyanobacteria bacterium PR.3.49]|nr:hypothetical protein [Cyanobacteria bacterium PR.3.49]
MNVKLSILSTIAIIAASSTTQAADAQNARFKFAPQTYRLEQAKLPAGYGEPVANPHQVTHGAAPKGMSALGLDPSMLAARPPAPRGPRVSPIAQQSVNSTLGFGNPVPFLNAFAPVANKGQFGQPLNVPPVVAALPPQAAKPQVAQARPLAPVTASSNVSGRIQPRRSSNSQNVSGRLAKPARALAARQGSPIQSYGSNFGYTAGSTAPSGSGYTTSTSVSGVIYKSTQKH